MSWLMIRWVLLLSCSLMITMLPLPTSLIWLEPPWPLLLLMYMMMFDCLSCVMVLIVFMGYALDVIQVGLLGEHVFALALSLGLAALKSHRFRYFILNQQMMFVGGVCLSYGGGLCLIDVLMGVQMSSGMVLHLFVQAASGALFWPWVKGVLDDCLQYKEKRSQL
ncbi:MAG: rod shape-determining protein MreD [Gammaproteobacteria bacterium]|nr:rod shape-determining protein MreD [Gammaproteobacteria bacterium]